MGEVCKCGNRARWVTRHREFLCDDCNLSYVTGKPRLQIKEQPKESIVVVTKKEDIGWNQLVTPRTLDNYIGQKAIKSEIRTMISAEKIHKIPIQHVLFSGSFGLGKTTLATMFAELIAPNNWTLASATSLFSKETLPKTKVVVIDEIHALRQEEWLLAVMDRGNQIILGATTTAGSLSPPLRSRFVSLILQPYTVSELKTIVNQAAAVLKYDVPDFVVHEVAQRGRFVARVALFLFKRTYDRIVLNNMVVTKKLAQEWFQEMEIDPQGLDNADRAYLSCLSDKPIGIQNLSAMTGLDVDTLQETVEPYLLVKGYVRRTPRGRILGDKKPIKVW